MKHVKEEENSVNAILTKVKAETAAILGDKGELMPESLVSRSQALAAELATQTEKPKKAKRKSKTEEVPKAETEVKRREVKPFIINKAVEEKTAYEKREYLRRIHNNGDSKVKDDPTERALTTMYRDENGAEQLYGLKKARELIIAYIKSHDSKEFTGIEIEKAYQVFGPGISDNTLNACRKLRKQGFLEMEKVPPESRRFHYVMKVLKVPEA